MSSEPPPLAADEAERLVALVAPAAAQHDLVLIGGQAVAFWQAQLQEYLPAAYRAVIASKDLDFEHRPRIKLHRRTGVIPRLQRILQFEASPARIVETPSTSGYEMAGERIESLGQEP